MSLTIPKEIPGMPDNYAVKLTFRDGKIRKLTVVKHQSITLPLAEAIPDQDKDGNSFKKIVKWKQVETGEVEFLTIENKWIVYHRKDIIETEYSENFSIMLDLQKKYNQMQTEKVN